MKLNMNHIKRIYLPFLLLLILFQSTSCQGDNKIVLAQTSGLDTNIDTLLENGKYNEVLYLYESRLKKIEEDSYEAANIHVWMGEVYFRYIKDMDKAIDCLEKACEISEKNQHMPILADACYALSNIYIEVENNAAIGLKYAEQAETIYRQYNGQNSIEIADTLHNKGKLYYELEQWQDALLNYEEAELIYEDLDLATGYTCIQIGKTLIELQEIERAEEMFYKAQSMAIASGEGLYAAKSKIYLGLLCIKREEYQKAIDIYQDARSYYESVGRDPVDLALVYNNLAFCYVELGGWEEGMPYAVKACQAMEESDPTRTGAREGRDNYKQRLKRYFKKWKPNSNDEEYEVWYQNAVLEGNGWEEEQK